MTEDLYNIYKLKNYSNTKIEFESGVKVNPDGTNQKFKFEGTMEEVLKKLEKDRGYHIRINPTATTILYGDFDHSTPERFQAFLNKLSKMCTVEIKKISYTESFKEDDNEYSYHFSIPTIQSNPLNIKRCFQRYCQEYIDTDELDLSVYSSKPFRLPMQTVKGHKKYQHKIIQGCMQDFIIEFTNNCKFPLKEFEEVVYTTDNNVNGEYSEEDMKKMLKVLNPNKNRIYWIKVANGIKNELGDDYMYLWDEWSKGGEKYNPKEITKTWNSLNHSDIRGSCLRNMAIKENPTLYYEYFPKPDPEFIDDEEESDDEESSDEESDDEDEPSTPPPQPKPVKENNSFAYMSKEFEKKHCLIINKSVYIKETDKGVIFFSKGKLKDSYEHLICGDKFKKDGKPELFIDAWMTGNKNKRRYDDCEVYPRPLVAPNNIYNLWTPFECEKYTTPYTKNDEALQLILNHIKILCNNDAAVSDYFIKWIGQMIQYPANKTVCPVIISKQGAGKGTLMRLLEKMLGKSKCIESTNPSRDVWGNFNGLMANAFFVNLNELSKKDTAETEGQFKGLVTDPHIHINNKGIGQVEIRSYHRFLITTNNEDPIKTSVDDRRNLIIRASDEVCGNKAYFSKLYKLLDDVNVIRTCYDYFNSIPNLEQFHELDTPKTEHQTNLAKLSLTPPEQFLIDLCSKKEGIVEILSKDLYDQFMSFTIDHNIEYFTTPLKFAVKLANLKISGFEKGKHTKKGDFKNIDIDKVRKHFKLGFVDDN